MYFFSTPALLKWVTPGYVHWNVQDGARKIYLTFDDGPHPGVTPEVLSILKKYGAKATFFCLGKNAEQHPGLIENILHQGHAIGNHTYGHSNGWRMSGTRYLQDVKK